jgi:hypothetical protein
LKNLGATINQITTGALKKMTFGFLKKTNKTNRHILPNLDNLIYHQRKYEKLVIPKSNVGKKCFLKKELCT